MVSPGSGTGIPPVNSLGQDGRATANDAAPRGPEVWDVGQANFPSYAAELLADCTDLWLETVATEVAIIEGAANLPVKKTRAVVGPVRVLPRPLIPPRKVFARGPNRAQGLSSGRDFVRPLMDFYVFW